jgi:hypothetical protein
MRSLCPPKAERRWCRACHVRKARRLTRCGGSAWGVRRLCLATFDSVWECVAGPGAALGRLPLRSPHALPQPQFSSSRA